MKEFHSNNGPLFILLSALLFSTSGTIQALAPQGITAISTVEIRSLIGSVFLFAVIFCQRLMNKKNWSLAKNLSLIKCSFFLLGAQLFFFFGMQKVGVAVGTVVDIGSVPIWTAIVAWVVYKKRPSRRWFLATALSILGVVLLNFPSPSSIHQLYWIVMPLMGGFCYSCYLTVSATIPKEIPLEISTASILAWNAVFLAPACFIFPISWAWTSINGILVALSLGILTAGLAFTFLLKGIQKTSPSIAATLGLAEPLGAAFLGIFLLGEPTNWATFPGIFLVILSIVLILFDQKIKEDTENCEGGISATRRV